MPFAALPRKDTIYKPFSLYLHREKYTFVHQMGCFGGETYSELPFVHQMHCFRGEIYSELPFVHQMCHFRGETVGKMG